MLWSEVPNWIKFLLTAFPLFFSMSLFAVWLDYRAHRKQKAQWEKDRLEGLQKDNEDLRRVVNEKNDEIFEHIEANTNLATERDALQMRVDDLERQLQDAKNKYWNYNSSANERFSLAVKKLREAIAVFED